MLIEASTFSLVNVGIGFVIAWLLSHYVLPALPWVSYTRSVRKTTAITMIYTVAALIRNVIVYWGFALYG